MIANKHLTPHRGQHLSVVPRRVRHQMMQRLMRAANIVGSQSCRLLAIIRIRRFLNVVRRPLDGLLEFEPQVVEVPLG